MQHNTGKLVMANIKFSNEYLAPPSRSSDYMKGFIKDIGLNPSSFAKTLGVSPSTVKRYLDGGLLTVNLASKIYLEHRVDPEILFRLDAKYLTNSAKLLAKKQKD